jgi:phosphoglycolate phosphatase
MTPQLISYLYSLSTMIKLVAFDWNGTLLADTKAAFLADNEAFKKFGRRPMSIKNYQKFFCIPIKTYWIKNGFSENHFKKHHVEINKIFCKTYEPLADICRSRTGTKVALDFLSKNKINAIIYSNHTIPDIERQLRRLHISSRFKTILARIHGDRSHMHNRGKERKLQEYVKKHKLKPFEVVSVGDTEEEIEIGKKYGFYTIAITDGYNNAARLKKHHPDFLIHNMRDLISIIKKLNK